MSVGSKGAIATVRRLDRLFLGRHDGGTDARARHGARRHEGHRYIGLRRNARGGFVAWQSMGVEGCVAEGVFWSGSRSGTGCLIG